MVVFFFFVTLSHISIDVFKRQPCPPNAGRIPAVGWATGVFFLWAQETSCGGEETLAAGQGQKNKR